MKDLPFVMLPDQENVMSLPAAAEAVSVTGIPAHTWPEGGSTSMLKEGDMRSVVVPLTSTNLEKASVQVTEIFPDGFPLAEAAVRT